jgi:hypothetical protein
MKKHHVVTAQEDTLDREEVARYDARRLRSQKLAPARPRASRCRLEPGSGEKTTDARRRDVEAELGQLATDPPVAPARILAREPQHQLLDLRRQRRSSAQASRLPPCPAHERPMPSQQRARSHQKRGARGTWQVAGCRREQRPISRPELRTLNLAPQNVQLMAKHHQLDVLDIQATAAPTMRTK